MHPEGELGRRYRDLLGVVNQIVAATYLIPATMLGTALSRLVHSRVNGPALRMAVLIFSIVSGAVLLFKS